MRYYLNCANDDCDCAHLIVESIEVENEDFILRLRCNFCDTISVYSLWDIWEAQGGDA